MPRAHEVISLGLLALSVGGIAWLVASVPVPEVPRLGHRGFERKEALGAGGLFSVAEPFIRFLAGFVALLPLEKLRTRQELELRQADHCLGLTADEYSAVSLLSAACLGAITAAITHFTGSDPLFVFPATLFGLFLPTLQVREIIRSRAKEVARGLPHTIEIAAMCMGAGLDFPGALRLLAQPAKGGKGALTKELGFILEELELGRTRKEALLAFGERVPTPAVRDLVLAIVQAEQKGNPLAHVMQVQGRMLSMRRSVAAEEAAARAGVLMVVPMVLLLGCVLVILMGPLMVKGIGF